MKNVASTVLTNYAKFLKSGRVDVQDGDMRSSILEIIQTDEDIMNSVVESVSQAIVTKFMNNPELK